MAPFLSLTMIVKNEAQNLEASLISAGRICDELVVVDTGSTDTTVAIAQRLGARVFHFDWCDDFAAARNFALDHARGAWVLHLDADETIVELGLGAIQAELAALEPEEHFLRVPVRCPWASGMGRDQYPARRLFRRHPDVRWKRRVHENIVNLRYDDPDRDRTTTNAVVDHSGYVDVSARRAQGKDNRNIRLLTLEALENPDDAVPLFYLAREHSSIGEHAEAVQICRSLLHRWEGRLAPAFEWAVRSIAVRNATSLNETAEAIAFGEAVADSCRGAELLYLLGCAHTRLGDDLARAEWCQRRALAIGEERVEYQSVGGVGTWRPLVELGNLAWRQEDRGAAISYWRRAVAAAGDEASAHLALGRGLLAAGRASEAAAPLREVVRLAPDMHEAHRHLADVEVAAGAAQAGYDRLYALVKRCPEQADHWHWLAHLLLRLDEPAAALDLLGEAIERHTSHAGIYLLLGTALQKVGRHEDALNAFSMASALAPDSELARAGIVVSAFRQVESRAAP